MSSPSDIRLDGCRILAVHHDPGLNGAALLFESIIEALAHDYGASVTARFPHDGPLVARAGRRGPVLVGDPPGAGRLRNLLNRVSGRGRNGPRMAWDVIFANSIASLGPLERLTARYPALANIPLVVYVHESAFLLQEFDFEATRRMLGRARLIFAVSSAVRETLKAVVRPPGKIVVVGGFLLERAGDGEASDLPPAVREAVRSGAPIVGGVGTLAWHKGTDLFVAVARRVRDLLPSHPLKFIWIGQEWTSDIRRLLERDIERAGLTDTVLLPGPTPDPGAFFESLSVFLLPSREDSWPLVMLESAAAGVPIVCFQRSGGAEEFIANGGGIAVPYLDVEAMAQAVVRYLTDPGARANDSDIARDLARAVSRDAQVRKVATEIELMLRSEPTAFNPAASAADRAR